MSLRVNRKPTAPAPALQPASNGQRTDGSESLRDGKAKDRQTTWRTLRYDELEDWRQDNDWILSGYAPLTHTLRGTVRTVFRIHNETVNVWSHLIGAAACLGLAVVLLSVHGSSTVTGRLGWLAPFSLIWPFPDAAQPSVTHEDSIYAFVFVAAAVICLGLSATFHASLAHSKEVSVALNRGDYVGIVVLIVGSNAPALHYGFYCHPQLKHAFMALVAGLGLAAGYVTLMPRYRPYRRLRTYVFIALGLSAVFPIAAALSLYGLADALDSFSLPWLALSGTFYIVGALLYAERFPERWKPGRFDIFGSSHQIFHVLILCAAWAHYACVAEGFRFRHLERQGSCPSA